MKAGLTTRITRLEQYRSLKYRPVLQLAYHGEQLPQPLGEPSLIVVLHRPGCGLAEHEGVCVAKEDVCEQD